MAWLEIKCDFFFFKSINKRIFCLFFSVAVKRVCVLSFYPVADEICVRVCVCVEIYGKSSNELEGGTDSSVQ